MKKNFIPPGQAKKQIIVPTVPTTPVVITQPTEIVQQQSQTTTQAQDVSVTVTTEQKVDRAGPRVEGRRGRRIWRRQAKADEGEIPPSGHQVTPSGRTATTDIKILVIAGLVVAAIIGISAAIYKWVKGRHHSSM